MAQIVGRSRTDLRAPNRAAVINYPTGPGPSPTPSSLTMSPFTVTPASGDGETQAFTLTPTPTFAMIFVNRLYQIPNVDYTLAGGVATFTVNSIPPQGALIYAEGY